MRGRAVAAIDVGSTWTKLAVYTPEGGPGLVEREPTPSLGGGLYDAQALLGLLRRMISTARRHGARAVGISLFRASPLAFLPGGRPLSPVVSWLAWRERVEAYGGMPLAGRLLSRAPVIGRAFRPQSPLPIISWLSRRYPRARVWTLDALVAEAFESRYASTLSHAALTGVVNPWSLRPMGWVLRLAGARPGLEVPELVHDRIGGETVSAIVADQQASMLGTGCTAPGCVKISLGTGCFADKPVEGKPPRLGGLIPLVVPTLEGVRYGVEASVPGLGLAIEWAAQALGGFEALTMLKPEHCKEWRGQLLLRAGEWPGSTVLLLGPHRPRSREELACAAIAGPALQCASAAARLGPVSRYVLAGGGMRPGLMRALLSALLPGRVEHCGDDAALRGAALLALGGGLEISRCAETGRGRARPREIMEVLRGAGEDPVWAMEEARRLVLGILGIGE